MKRFMNIKKIVTIIVLVLALSMTLASCNFSGIEPNPPASDEGNGGEQPGNPDQPATPSNPENPEDGTEEPEEQKVLTYEEYINMTADEQEAFVYSFSDIHDFFLWHTEAKAKYDEEHKPPVIDGDVDIGDLLGPQE